MKLIIDVPKEYYETIKTTLSFKFNYLEEKVRQATPLQEELKDIKTISEALIAICDHECCMYGMEEAVKLAEKYTEDV